MTDPGTAVDRAEPGRATRWGVMAGVAKAGLEDLWWVDQVTNDPAWVRRASLVRTLPILVPYLILGFLTGNWGFILGALIGLVVVRFVAVGWRDERVAASTRDLHGIGRKRSGFADWSPGLYAGFNAAMVVAVLGLFVLVIDWIDSSDGPGGPDVLLGTVDCVAGDGTLDFDVLAFNRTGAPQRVTIDFRYVEPLGNVVTVPTVATITPDGRQEVVATVAVDVSQGCFGTGASVRAGS